MKETFKDIRLSLYLIVKDLNRLSEDVQCLANYIEVLEKGIDNEVMAYSDDTVLAKAAAPWTMEGVLPDRGFNS